MASGFSGVSPCLVFCTLDPRYIKNLSYGWCLVSMCLGVLGVGKMGVCLPQGFWGREWREILGRTVSPTGLPHTSPTLF